MPFLLGASRGGPAEVPGEYGSGHQRRRNQGKARGIAGGCQDQQCYGWPIGCDGHRGGSGRGSGAGRGNGGGRRGKGADHEVGDDSGG